MFKREGRSLSLMLLVAGHEASTCSMEHSARHRRQQLLSSEPMKQLVVSHVRNFKYGRSFLTSCVLEIFKSAGCGRPDIPLCVLIIDSFDLSYSGS